MYMRLISESVDSLINTAGPVTNERNRPSGSVTEQRLKNKDVYRVDRSASLVDDVVSSQSKASNLHDRSQNLYEHVEQPEMELVYI